MSNKITCLVRTSRPDSHRISLQQCHIDLFVKDLLFSIVLMDKADNIINIITGDDDLQDCIGSAIKRGKQRPFGQFNVNDYYYLGDLPSQ